MKILVFGASTTQGANDTECGGWVDRIKAHCFSLTEPGKEKIHVFNLGVSGQTSADLLNRIDKEIIDRTRKERQEKMAILLSVGLNESKSHNITEETSVSVSEYRENLERLLTLAKGHSEHVFFVGFTPVDEASVAPIPWNTEYSFLNKNIDTFDDVAHECFERYEGIYISLEGIFGEDYKKYLSDGLHPNAEGHRLICERVREALEKEGLI